MKLYHGSKNNFTAVRKNQAGNPDNVDVPENELLNAIYLTPDYGFALACAARPEGWTNIDGENKTISFENPELFDPNEEILVYEIDIKNVPEENVIEVDDHQYAITDTNELEISNKFTHKAGEVEKYYKIIDQKRENANELRNNFKLR